MNSQVLGELLKILQQESGLYGSLHELSKDKTRIIVEGKVAELENIVKLEQAIVMQLGKLGSAREELIEKLAGEMQVQPSELNITNLIEKVGGKYADELRDYQQNMTSIVNDLKNSNELNSRLIRNSLDFIEFSINMLTESENAGNNYGSAGTTGTSQRKSLLDIKL